MAKDWSTANEQPELLCDFLRRDRQFPGLIRIVASQRVGKKRQTLSPLAH